MNRPDKELWTEAIHKELQSLEDVGTFKFINSLPPNKHAIGGKLVFRLKRNSDGSVERHKARLVAKGVSQVPGIEFDKTLAPVVRFTSIRIMCALAVKLKLHFHYLDVETVLLNSFLEVEIYMRITEGWKGHWKNSKTQLVTLGLRQASRIWRELPDRQLKLIGRVQTHPRRLLHLFPRNLCRRHHATK